MLNNLVGEDINLNRLRYDEALNLQGIPCTYQYPSITESNVHGESVPDSMSQKHDTYVFFDGNPKVKTYKRYGWTVENDQDLPFLIHCSWNLPHVQKDSIFNIGGQYTGLPDRMFRVTEITYDMQAPDHLICQVIPVYDDKPIGRFRKETEQKFNKSNTFLKQPTDYKGRYISEQEGDR